jgi:glycosyltransferase involved in cell wall biosynthesis
MKTALSIVVLARDEARNLARCLPPLAFADEVVVIDDRSTDGTAAAAAAHGARVVPHALQTFADQRNWAMDAAGLRHPWVLHLDADEVVTPPLASEIDARLAACPPAAAGFFLTRKTMMGDRWLRFSAMYPVYVLRLVRRGRVRFAQEGHGEKPGQVDGSLDYLNEPCLHYNFSKGWGDWFDRHNRYSTAEAERLAREDMPADWRGLAAADPVRRRAALRGLSYRLPCRPALRFLYVWLWRGGFLDGGPGYLYARLQAVYEYMITLKLRAARRPL